MLNIVYNWAIFVQLLNEQVTSLMKIVLVFLIINYLKFIIFSILLVLFQCPYQKEQHHNRIELTLPALSHVLIPAHSSLLRHLQISENYDNWVIFSLSGAYLHELSRWIWIRSSHIYATCNNITSWMYI